MTGEQPPMNGDLRLTYAQLAGKLGISNDAARQLVRRRRWRRIVPNRLGAPAIVVVPEDELEAEEWRQDRPTPPDNRVSPPGASPGEPDTSPDDRADFSRSLNILQAAVASLTDRAVAAEQRADRTERERDALRIELTRAEERLHRGEIERLVEAAAKRSMFRRLWGRGG
jgi:hypothetical protein